MPQVKQEYFPLGGGLDQLTPAIALKPGLCIDAQNYEPEISGGYRRIDGYEAFDGRPSPTSASYWLMNTAGNFLFTGSTITGQTSGATAIILDSIQNGIGPIINVLGRLTGTFILNETILVSAVPQASVSSVATKNSATYPVDDATYSLEAANDLRLDIGAVPGSGPIRGVWVYNDVVYAFRDNSAGTAGLMYKSTVAGWVLFNFGTEIQFSSTMGGAAAITAGQTIGNLGAAPTKTANVIAVLTRSGTWGTDAVGSMIIQPVTGSFSNTDPIFVGATQKAVATTAATAITRLPGGKLDFSNYNFTSSSSGTKFYGADGVNLAFEFDGTNYIPIRTGMAVDTPTHVIGHRNFLFLSFQGSVQLSGIANPYAWTAVLGAAEIACGFPVTGFVPQGGTSSGSSLAIFTKAKVFILYGSDNSTFTLIPSNHDIGYSAFTMQLVSNNTYGLTARGIQCLVTTLTYGDFDFDSIAHAVTPYVNQRMGMETCSTTSHVKNQYRLYYSDGTCLATGLTGDTVNGTMPLNYGIPVRCIVTATLSTGSEVTYFGSDDGFVYQDSIGTSFNGKAIEAWIRMSFNHSKSPGIRKRYRRAYVEAKSVGYASININYDLGYATPNILAPAMTNNQIMTGGGNFWDQFTWDQFTWDSAFVEEPILALEGTEKNISFLFYSNSAMYKSITIQGVRVSYTPQRLDRS